MFEARIHEAKGDYEKAIETLNRKNVLVDDISKFEKLADNHLKIGNREKTIEYLE